MGIPLRTLLRHRRLTARLLWDVFMVWVALVNLSLILFDLSYLLLRPTFFRWVPVVTRLYDPVKGIEAHPLTSELEDAISTTRQLLGLDPTSDELPERVDALTELTARVLLENPFERSGQTRHLEVIRVVVAQAVGTTSASLHRPDAVHQAANDFWSDDPATLGRRLDLASERIVPLLEVNYFREFDLAGRLVDHFWIIDLPFLALFWIEFSVRWVLAIRRREHARWFFFPILNWYDVLGLIPSRSFRAFRLLRAVSMYMRLRRSDLSRVGKDVFSRSVAYISNIITEEVSDMVSLRILGEYQEAIRDGTHLHIIEATIGARRAEIERVLADQILAILTDPRAQEKLRELLLLNLDTAVEESEALRSVPLPSPLVRPVVRAVGQVILDTTLEAVDTTLASSEGQTVIDDLVRSVADQIATGPGLAEIESLTREISLDVIEHMKQEVGVKKWALAKSEDPEEGGVSPRGPWDGGDEGAGG